MESIFLKSHGATINYRPSRVSGNNKVSVLIFSDVDRMEHHGGISYFAGILIGPF